VWPGGPQGGSEVSGCSFLEAHPGVVFLDISLLATDCVRIPYLLHLNSISSFHSLITFWLLVAFYNTP